MEMNCFLGAFMKRNDIRYGQRFEIVRKRDNVTMGVYWIEDFKKYGPVLATEPTSYWTAAEALQKLEKHVCYAKKMIAWRCE